MEEVTSQIKFSVSGDHGAKSQRAHNAEMCLKDESWK